MTGDGIRNAVTFYTQALEKDPNFVQAHVGLAEADILEGTDFLPAREVMPKATVHALKALELQPSRRATGNEIGQGQESSVLSGPWCVAL